MRDVEACCEHVDIDEAPVIAPPEPLDFLGALVHAIATRHDMSLDIKGFELIPQHICVNDTASEDQPSLPLGSILHNFGYRLTHQFGIGCGLGKLALDKLSPAMADIR